jgi:hypothetical protein
MSDGRKTFVTKTAKIFFAVGLVCSTGMVTGFRCHCALREGQVTRAHTVAFLIWPQKIAGPPKKVFDPLHDIIHLAVFHRDMEPESEIRVRWVYLGPGGGGSGEKKGAQKRKLFSAAVKIAEGSGVVYFGAHRRGKVWPSGPYEALVEHDGRVVQRVPFAVSGKTRYRLDLIAVPGGEVGDVADGDAAAGRRRVRVFSTQNESVLARLTALNPKPGTLLRVMWDWRKPGTKTFRFYAESDEIKIDTSKRIVFRLPPPKKGYCRGDYRVRLRMGGQTVVTRVFRMRKPHKSATR